MAEQIRSIKEVIKDEYKRCAVDPIHFLKKYVYIQTSEGRMLFNPYPFQDKLLFLLNKHDRTIILKSRQLGITTLTAAYALWLMIYKKDQSILALAPTQEKAKNIVDKVRFAYSELPSWMKVSALEDNKLSLILSNGSKIKAASGASDSARGYTANLLILDEAAFIENAEDLWGSAQQTLATGGRAIILSTPNGMDGFFHKNWSDAEVGDNNFIPVKLRWDVHPKRNIKWREDQDKELGKRMAAQECDCDFLSSGDTYFDPEDLEYYSQHVEEPFETRGPQKDYWIWEYPDPNKNYMVVVDTGRGDGSDSSAIQIIDIYSGNQAAEYKGNMETKMLSKFAVSIATEYNNALLVVENTGLGHATMSDVLDIGYNNIYYSPKGDTLNVTQYVTQFYEYDTSRMTPGFTTSTKTRPEILLAMRNYVIGHLIKIRSVRTKNEMRTFVWKNGKPQAQSTGYHDDLIMAYAIGLYLRDSAIQYRSQGVDMQRAVLGNMRKPQGYLERPNVPPSFVNPYEFNINGQKEDISWLVR
jgi:hypothetical protein